jgi:hypothetical protein
MSRLPQIGSDADIWGNVLNDFLSVEHANDGTLKIRTDGTLTGFYAKPTSGIPSADLTTVVQASLTKADTAVQVNGDLAGTSGSPVVAKINGVTLSGSPTPGQALIASSPTTASWGTLVGNAMQVQAASAQLAINSYSGIPSPIDGVSLTDGQTVFLNAEPASFNNGPWVVHSGTWTRPPSYAVGKDVTGSIVFVQGGNSNGATIWLLQGLAPKIVGTNGTSWTQLRETTDRGLINSFSLYNTHDVVTVNNLRVLITKPCQATGAGFISSSNYVILQYLSVVDIRAYGAKVDGTTDDTVAIQNAINSFGTTGTSTAGTGGVVSIPAGITRTSATLQLPSNVHLKGAGWSASCIQLLPSSNCHMIQTYVSTGSGNSNSFWSSVRDLTLDGRKNNQGTIFTDGTITAGSTIISSAGQHTFANGEYLQGIGILPGTTITSGGGTTAAVMSQPATTAASQNTPGNTSIQVGGPWHGIYHTTNPYSSAQTGDSQYDPSHLFADLRIYFTAGDGIYVHGRSDIQIHHVKVSFAAGNGFTVDFDTKINECMTEKVQGSGLELPGHSGDQITNCKFYNSYGYGVYIHDGASTGELTLTNIDCQQCNLDGVYIKNQKNAILQGITISQAGFSNTAGNVSNTSIAAGISLNAVLNCIIDASIQNGTNGLRVTSASAKNDLRLTNTSNVSGAIDISTDSQALLGSSNSVTINGGIISPGLTGFPDVTISGPTNGQGLVYNTSLGKWQNGTVTGVLSLDSDVSITAPSDGQILSYSGSLGKWTNAATSGSGAFYANIFGNGAAGAITLDGTTAYSSYFTLVGSTYTLKPATGIQFASLTVNGSVTLNTAGMPLQVAGPLTNNGTITNAGGNAAGVTAGTTPGKNMYTGQAGRTGGTGVGGAGFNTNGTAAGTGGTGGNGSSGVGGTGGTVSSNNQLFVYQNPQVVLAGSVCYFGAVVPVGGGGSGAAGAGDGTNSGGGGGGGGGFIAILAHSFANNGTVTAAGGKGGMPLAGNCGGGGGGGGGTIIVYTLTPATGAGTTIATGGNGGAATGAGTAGGNGGSGQVYQTLIA